jgi:hypothetical protein
VALSAGEIEDAIEGLAGTSLHPDAVTRLKGQVVRARLRALPKDRDP